MQRVLVCIYALDHTSEPARKGIGSSSVKLFTAVRTESAIKPATLKPRRGFPAIASGAYQILKPQRVVFRSIIVEDGDPLDSMRASKDSDDLGLR